MIQKQTSSITHTYRLGCLATCTVLLSCSSLFHPDSTTRTTSASDEAPHLSSTAAAAATAALRLRADVPANSLFATVLSRQPEFPARPLDSTSSVTLISPALLLRSNGWCCLFSIAPHQIPYSPPWPEFPLLRLELTNSVENRPVLLPESELLGVWSC